jgi:hypothetical protein
MDPNGSLTKDLGNYTSEDYICYVSPLHEALRGTTAMPTLEEFEKLNNGFSISASSMNSMSITPEFEEEAMFPADRHSMLSYNMDVAFRPCEISFGSIPVATMDSTSPFVANFTVSTFVKTHGVIVAPHLIFFYE